MSKYKEQFLNVRVDIIPISELSESMKQDWQRMQKFNPSLMTPFFCPELFLCVAQYYTDVYVALLYEGKNLTGFLPFKRDLKNLAAKPIRFCNYEGIISLPGQNWDMNVILRKIGVNSWHFDSILNHENLESKRGDSEVRYSFGIDLTAGLEEYWAFIQTRKVRLNDLKGKRRRLGIIKGPLRFVANCCDVKVIHQLVQWVSLRYNHDLAWIKETTTVLEQIYHSQDSNFRVIMPALYAGDELVAADFHLWYQGCLGGLLRTFNPNFEKFSVGVLILHDLINQHKELEYSMFDLGPEAYQYKLEYANSVFPTFKGNVRVDSLKERIKSVNWLYQGLLPIVRLKGIVVTKLSNSNI